MTYNRKVLLENSSEEFVLIDGYCGAELRISIRSGSHYTSTLLYSEELAKLYEGLKEHFEGEIK